MGYPSLPLVFVNYLYPWCLESASRRELCVDRVIPGCPIMTKVFRRKLGQSRPFITLLSFFSLPLFSSLQTFCSRSHSKHWSFLVLLCRDVWALQPLLCMCVSDQRLLLHHPLSHKAKVSGWTCTFFVHRAICSLTDTLQTRSICCQVYAIFAQETLPSITSGASGRSQPWNHTWVEAAGRLLGAPWYFSWPHLGDSSPPCCWVHSLFGWEVGVRGCLWETVDLVGCPVSAVQWQFAQGDSGCVSWESGHLQLCLIFW